MAGATTTRAARPARSRWGAGAVITIGLVAAVLVMRSGPPALSARVVPSSVGDAIPGQAIVLLVTFTGGQGIADEAEVTAEPLAFHDDVTVSVSPDRIAAGQVAEVTVVIGEAVVAGLPNDEPRLGQPQPIRTPDEQQRPTGPDSPMGPEGVAVPVRVTLARGTTVESVDVPVNVSPGEDTLLETATLLRDRFVAWLANEQPELGITPATTWTPTIVQPHILVVSHYLFFSEEWELGLMWHIMAPPYDWSRMYLRPRDVLAPTHAFEIPSVTDPTSSIHEFEVPVRVDR